MFKGLYTAVSGMQVNQRKLDVASNNMANVNTTGFKKDIVISETFRDTLIKQIGGNESGKTIGTSSAGLGLQRSYINFLQGSMDETGNNLNFAIKGDGFFRVMTPEGEMYTRNGSFTLNQNGQLVTSEGYPLLGQNGAITLDNGDFQLDTNGQIIVNGQVQDTINMVNITNTDDLDKFGESYYVIREGLQIEAGQFQGELLQGYLETSNINPVEEMVNMINIMRSYETSSKALKAYDDILQRAVNEVGKL